MGFNWTAIARLSFNPDDLSDVARGLLMFKTYVDEYPEASARRQALVGVITNAFIMLIASNDREKANQAEYQSMIKT